MSRKSLLIMSVTLLILVFMLAGSLLAQTPAEAKQKFEELIEQVRDLDQKMKVATPEAYEGLLQERQNLVVEINKYRSMLEGDQETKKAMNDIKKKYNDGTRALKYRRFGEAITNFTSAVDQGAALGNPLISDVIAMSYYQMGQAFKAQKNWDKMRESMQNAANEKSDLEKAYFEMGYALERLSRADEAEKAYSHAKEIDPKYYKAAFNLGVLYYRKSHFDRAIDEFMTVIQINPQYSRAFLYLGRSYFEKKAYNSAETALRTATELNGKSYEAPWYLAQCLNKMGTYSQAVDAANMVIDIRGSFGGGFFERGLANKGLGRKAQALADFERAKSDKNFKQLAEYQIKWYDKGN